MKGFILSAGFGKRMQEFTKACPKPLLPVGGYPLIYYALYALYKLDVSQSIINLHYLGDQIRNDLKDFPYFPLHFSEENPILDTAGGIRKVIGKYLNDDEFIVLINPDSIFKLAKSDLKLLNAPCENSWLFLKRKLIGEMTGIEYDPLSHTIQFNNNGKWFYPGLSKIHTASLSHLHVNQVVSLSEIWRTEAANNRLGGEILEGNCMDVGTKNEYIKLHKQFPFEDDPDEKSDFLQFISGWKHTS